MNKVKEIADSQSFAYASAYAIQVIPLNKVKAHVAFLADDGLPTEWPCRAKHFDSVEEAEQYKLTVQFSGIYEEKTTRLEVVQISLNATIRAVSQRSEGLTAA